MLDIKFIRQNADLVRKAIQTKQIALDLDTLLEADQLALREQRDLQKLEEEKNQIAAEVPKATLEKRPELIARGKDVSAKVADRRELLKTAQAKLQELLWLVPNIPDPTSPVGPTDAENVEVKRWGDPAPKALDHVALLEKHGWAEFQRVAQIAGARSYALKNEAALLEMALWRFALDRLRTKGFNLISVPSLARAEAFYGTGHFPTGREQAYHLQEDDLYLAGTAEVLLNSLHAGEMLAEAQLPLLYAGFSPCFRREAGSAGRDTRGLIRVHQFMKVEQFVMCRNDPEESRHWHQKLLETSEEILQALELPYRVMNVCTGDMGVGKIRQHDLEAWVPSEGRYRETHSCSTLHDWQARRANLRYRAVDGTIRFCHSLNNTAIATPRILVPLLENHQQPDGSIRLPKALELYGVIR
jgi:seryl-tRNA synthetase